jgi:hypothetical protein
MLDVHIHLERGEYMLPWVEILTPTGLNIPGLISGN